MKRIHAPEWEDFHWFPVDWRDYGTDYLRFIATKFDIYKPILPILRKGINASKQQDWVDCASEKELKALVASLNNSDAFEWEIGKVKNGPMPIYYLLGTQKL